MLSSVVFLLCCYCFSVATFFTPMASNTILWNTIFCFCTAMHQSSHHTTQLQSKNLICDDFQFKSIQISLDPLWDVSSLRLELTCYEFKCMDMIWKNQAMRLKAYRAQREDFLTSGEVYKHISEHSHNYVAFIICNGRITMALPMSWVWAKLSNW